MDPVVSVVIVSDYASGQAGGWCDLRAIARGFAQQDFDELAEHLVVESADFAPQIPPDLQRILPALRVVVSTGTSAAALKNDGARAASADLVAMIDADCIPDPGWLRHFVTTMRQHPGVAVVSGRTTYAGRSVVERIMALVTRSFLDEGRTAPTRHVTINNAGFRRAVLLAHPLPASAGPHMSMLQTEAILRSGGRLLFEPRMRVVHAYGGWENERQIRRSLGYGVISVRRCDPRIRYASLARLGYLSVPVFVAGRTLHAWWSCLRVARHYGVAWYELPMAFALAAAASALEAPGMLRAVRDQPAHETLFR